jgi:hypothetical protein
MQPKSQSVCPGRLEDCREAGGAGCKTAPTRILECANEMANGRSLEPTVTSRRQRQRQLRPSSLVSSREPRKIRGNGTPTYA